MLPYVIKSKEQYRQLEKKLDLLEKGLVQVSEKLGLPAVEDEKLLQQILTNFDHLLKTQKEREEEEKLRIWKDEGLTKFLKTIRTEQHNVHNLCDKLLADLVKQLDANQGAIFLKNELTDETVQLISTYAWGKKKYLVKEVEMGEGLVGQCMQEMAEIYLTDIPEDFIQISSGLGLGLPKCIIILPLMANEQLLGVIELASFKIFEKHHREFLYGLLENLASTLLYEINNQKTRHLLDTTKIQQEQMRSQEEELRQNLEELQATQESQERLNNELRENEEIIKKKLLEAEMATKALEEKEIELQKVVEKSKQRAQKFREKMEELDILLESKQAEINTLKQQLELTNAN
ncbi:MAG: GAF domain-containing protein [Luteibaculaceae bacterium]